jgi:hypothetical protein
MRKLAFLLAAAGLCAAIPARAQDTPRWELFGGYSFFHTESGKEVVPIDKFGTFPNLPFAIDLGQSLNGLHGMVAENVTSWFSGVADFGGGFTSTTVNYTSVGGPMLATNRSLFTYQFGPQFSLRKFAPVTVFVHALIGGAQNRAKYAPDTSSLSTNAWASEIGGGIDVRVTQHLAIRVLQADWLRTHFPISLASDTQNNWSASAGVVLRIGQH